METSVASELKTLPIDSEIKKVSIVCRLNQARSLLSEHWLSRMYPKLDISSHGIEADSRIPIPKSVRDIALRWGFDLTGAVSRNFNACPSEEFAETLLIFAEEEFLESFRSKKGKSLESVSFQALNLDKDLVAVDPIGLDKSHGTTLEAEIAKALLCTSMAYHLTSESSTPLSRILFPNDESALSKTLSLAQELRPEKAILLDLDFHYNSFSRFVNISTLVEWDGTYTDMTNSVIPSLKSSAFSKHRIHPNKESFNPEGLILSREFLDSIKALTDNFQVIAICGPLNVNGKQQVATILSLALATNHQRVY